METGSDGEEKGKEEFSGIENYDDEVDPNADAPPEVCYSITQASQILIKMRTKELWKLYDYANYYAKSRKAKESGEYFVQEAMARISLGKRKWKKNTQLDKLICGKRGIVASLVYHHVKKYKNTEEEDYVDGEIFGKSESASLGNSLDSGRIIDAKLQFMIIERELSKRGAEYVMILGKMMEGKERQEIANEMDVNIEEIGSKIRRIQRLLEKLEADGEIQW